MRVQALIPVRQIKMDRSPLNTKTLSLVDFLRSGGTVPPIHVQLKNGSFYIRNGRHRVTAFKLLGRQLIDARYGKAQTQAQVPPTPNPEADSAPFWEPPGLWG